MTTLTHSVIVLPHWNELVGVLESISEDQHSVLLKINTRELVIPKSSARQLSMKLIGQKLAILRTDLSEMPFLVRLISKKKSARLQANSDELL